jgi:hypothetical protein
MPAPIYPPGGVGPFPVRTVPYTFHDVLAPGDFATYFIQVEEAEGSSGEGPSAPAAIEVALRSTTTCVPFAVLDELDRVLGRSVSGGIVRVDSVEAERNYKIRIWHPDPAVTLEYTIQATPQAESSFDGEANDSTCGVLLNALTLRFPARLSLDRRRSYARRTTGARTSSGRSFGGRGRMPGHSSRRVTHAYMSAGSYHSAASESTA